MQMMQAAVLARPGSIQLASVAALEPSASEVVQATFMPHIRPDSELLVVLVACIGTSLSAYIYIWESNQEVQEQIVERKRQLW